MEALNDKTKQALKDAVEKRRKDEELERSLGRAMRAAGLDYEAYIHLVGRVRDISRRKKIALEEAALGLLDEKEQ
ncbi:MAG: hypothetical protein LUO79_08880 [Methanomassiliicoccales archaeon]|nr:hypothetical protein [Methanomassiliicoccales archaeon]